jgi:hypothetical protein
MFLTFEPQNEHGVVFLVRADVRAYVRCMSVRVCVLRVLRVLRVALSFCGLDIGYRQGK